MATSRLNTGVNILRAAWATALFELSRSLTPGRLAASLMLALFPPTMMGLILIASGFRAEIEIIIMITVFMVILLALLLWASPVVYAELEGRTWIYLASRPKGRISTVLGKYLLAVFWSFTVAWSAMTICVIFDTTMNPRETFHVWWVFSLLIALASMTYAAVFILIGALFHRRAMVFCAGYVLLSEIALPNVPAVVSRFTVRYHLFSLALDLLGWTKNPTLESMFNRQPAWLDILMLLLITSVALGATVYTLQSREYLTADEA